MLCCAGEDFNLLRIVPNPMDLPSSATWVVANAQLPLEAVCASETGTLHLMLWQKKPSKCPAWHSIAVAIAVARSCQLLCDTHFTGDIIVAIGQDYFDAHGGPGLRWRCTLLHLQDCVERFLTNRRISLSLLQLRLISQLACTILTDLLQSVEHWKLETVKWRLLHGGFKDGSLRDYGRIRPMVTAEAVEQSSGDTAEAVLKL